MSDRRMFSKRITQTAKFLQMPPTSQLLYFHLGLNADDDGVVEAFPIMRMIKSAEDDLRVLIAKGLVKILNQDLVVFICDWQENNYIRGDRKKDSIYKDLLVQLIDQENSENISNFDMSGKCQSDDSQMPAQDKLSKVKSSKDKLNKDIDTSLAVANTTSLVKPNEFIDYFSKVCPSLPQIKAMTDKRKKAINSIIKQYGTDKLVEVLKKTEASDFLSGRNGKWCSCNIDWIIKPSNFIKVLEGNYDNSRKKETEDEIINREYKKTIIQKNKPKSEVIRESFNKLDEWIYKFDNKERHIDVNN